MNTRSTANRIRTIDRLRPSFFGLSGGLSIYEIDASSGKRWPTVPEPVNGTAILFYALDATSQILIKAKASASINGSTTEELELENVGDAVLIIADGDDWRVLNLGTTQIE